ncbi:MAG: trypsin-like peptidase domain-containing protein [Candidatus Schekmanbacteria bacterium]|nr:trypsin-like peptidase domain-containing protein [Candidatus Schekmanbacteria bacterium]
MSRLAAQHPMLTPPAPVASPRSRRARRFGPSVAAAMMAGLALFSPASSRAGGDERVIVDNPMRHPFNTVVKVRIGSDGNGRGSGVLVADCTILTNGHVAYNRSDDDYRTIHSVIPGDYYDEDTSSTALPYGSQTPVDAATNSNYVDTGEEKYDYAALFVGSPFSGISTYMPVSFDYGASYVNVAGYPSEDLSSSREGAGKEQWRGWGDVWWRGSRLMWYRAASSGGQSGGPVWVLEDDGDRYVVGVNRAHTNDNLDGEGVRFVDNNEDLVTGWMDNGCSRSRTAQSSLSFDELLDGRQTLSGEPIEVLSPEELGLMPRPRNVRGKAAYRVAQVIEGSFYRWEVYQMRGGAPRGHADGGEIAVSTVAPTAGRFIRLIAPETRWLDTDEAAVLLSASRLWMTQPAPALPLAASAVDRHEPDGAYAVRDEAPIRRLRTDPRAKDVAAPRRSERQTVSTSLLGLFGRPVAGAR